MNYYLDLFSPETHAKFSESDKTVSGFRVRQRNAAAKVKPGDLLVCYMTRISRWVGLLRVESAAFEDSKPVFVAGEDPFVVRFKVTPLVWLPPARGIPIHADAVWSKLSKTKDYDQRTSSWTGFFRNSLNQLTRDDGAFLEKLLRKQAAEPTEFPLTEDDRRKLEPQLIRRADGAVSVSLPDDGEDQEAPPSSPRGARESIRMQATLARVGAIMGMKVWIPANDRAAVIAELEGNSSSLVDELPLNYDKVTLGTIERIDVLWLKGRAIARAFEVEDTTAIYSGLLRMADLLSLQPNMDIRLHIVAPEDRREKVFREIRRPVFSLIERRPLYEMCTFLSYDSVRELSKLPHLAHARDSVLDEYAEEAE